MDVLWFLKQRVAFVGQLFATASAPYIERKGKIERGEEPYIPPFSEDPEPSFLTEWLEADESLQVLAQSCLSMLSASLKLYFRAWQREAGYPLSASAEAEFKKKRWLHGYQRHFLDRLGIDIKAGPVEFDLLHEVVLARNRIQHPESIVQSRTTFSDSDLRKVKHPFFLDESERDLLTSPDGAESRWLLEPSLHLPPEKLTATLSALVEFAEWFEGEVCSRLYSH